MNKINWINGQAGGTPLSAENLNQMQDNFEDAIDEVDEKFSKTILWEKESGINTFPAQTVALSSSDYDYLIIFYYRTPASREETYSHMVEKNQVTDLTYFDYFGSVVRAWSRKVTSNGNTLVFENALINGDATHSEALIPYKVVGCKY